MRGMAVAGALARAVESKATELGENLVPGRFTLDLFRPVRMTDLSTEVTVVRNGRRLCLLDALLLQNGEVMARASASFVAPSDSSGSSAWPGTPDLIPKLPRVDLASLPDESERIYGTDSRGWMPLDEVPYDADRKWVWMVPAPVVEGEVPTGFQAAASCADVVSVVANLDEHGLGFINTDLTMTLARQPVGAFIGLVANSRTEAAGVSAASAAMFDAEGACGLVSATSLSAAPIMLTPPMKLRYER